MLQANGLMPFRSTPLREGRPLKVDAEWLCYAFRSTPLREGRHPTVYHLRIPPLFRSTPLREGRHTTPAVWPPIASFDPRPCVRGDHYQISMCWPEPVSIHAPGSCPTEWCNSNSPVMTLKAA